MTNQVENETKSGASKKKWKLGPWMLTGVVVPLAVAGIAYLGTQSRSGKSPAPEGSPAEKPPVVFIVFSPLQKEILDEIEKVVRARLNVYIAWHSTTEGTLELEKETIRYIDDADWRGKGQDAIVLGGSYTFHERLAEGGYLLELDKEWIKKHEKRTGGALTSYWVGWYRGFLAVAYRKDLLGEFSQQGEFTWTELHDRLMASPEPRVILENPHRATGGEFFAFGIYRSMGASTETFLRDLYSRCICASIGAEDDVRKLLLGDAAASVNWEHDLRRAIYELPQARGALEKGLIEIRIPKQTPWEVGAASVLRSTKENYDRALEVLDLLLSDEVATLQQKIGRRYPVFDYDGRSGWPNVKHLLLKQNIALDKRDMETSLKIAQEIFVADDKCEPSK